MIIRPRRSPSISRSLALVLAAFALATSAGRAADGDFQPVDTQKAGQPLPPKEALSRVKVPEGFQVTLAAAEPMVRQPIAISFDDRGRLWVAECYSYHGYGYTQENSDRILIFEDKDGDGVFESRRVFCDKLNRLTGLAWGFGGVWVAAAPHLMFIPDRDGDDRPDSEPVIHLDGWALTDHTAVNGLTWSPEGWLYGRHGLKEASFPGRPGTPQKERPEVRSGVWRYHPIKHVFEIVADGTVNPWGLDFDDQGQMFMDTSVVEHLWHVVPGSHLSRREERDFPVQPHIYELATQTNDHSHRSTRVDPAHILPGADGNGGGHAHVGMMIYLGDRWPESYRGALLINNVNGRRVNRERIVRDGGQGRFIGRHEPDFIRVDDPWFRGVSLEYGPDGDAVLTDWSDQGECHDRDGVHRTSGRIYKISWGAPRHVPVNLEGASIDELVAFQLHRNDWFVRHARRLLQERAHAGADMTKAHATLRRMFHEQADVTRKLRALWALFVTGGADAAWLTALVDHPEESVRYWSARLLVDSGAPPEAAEKKMIAQARAEDSWLARMGLASALKDTKEDARWQIGAALAERSAAAEDPNLVRLIWAGWQSAVPAHAVDALTLAPKLPNARLRQWLPRRLAEAAAVRPELAGQILAVAATAGSPAVRIDLLTGMETGLERRDYPLSSGPLAALRALFEGEDLPLRHAALFLGAKLRDKPAVERMRAELLDARLPVATRTRILQAVTPAKPAWLVDELLGFLARGELGVPVLRALATSDDSRIVPAVLARYERLAPAPRSAAIDTLLARPSSANALLDAVVAGRLAKSEISQVQARQAAKVGGTELRRRFEEIWGATNASSEAITTQIRKLFMFLRDLEYMRVADRSHGRTIFEQRCAVCHTLFDQGGKFGPDLTGSGRKDVNYLLLNIVDPNASILADWRLTTVTLTDGRVLTGSNIAERENFVVLQTAEGPTTIERKNIGSIERHKTSIMPTGLLDDMTAEQVRDLFAYLMSDSQTLP